MHTLSKETKDKVLVIISNSEDYKSGDIHQALMHLGYDEWQKEDNNWSYADMIEFVDNTYGREFGFVILIGKYNQQVCNGGHIQYFDNGYASGGGGCFENHDLTMPLHAELIQRFKEFQLDKSKLGKQVYNILTRFRIEKRIRETVCISEYNESTGEYESFEDELDGGEEFANMNELNNLDQKYYEINEDFEKHLNDVFTSWLAN